MKTTFRKLFDIERITYNWHDDEMTDSQVYISLIALHTQMHICIALVALHTPTHVCISLIALYIQTCLYL